LLRPWAQPNGIAVPMPLSPLVFAWLRKRRNSAELLTETRVQLKYMLYMFIMV
jgi:hypothetical protein